MDKDIFEDYQTLLNEGIIKELGSRKSNITQYEVAEANDFKDGKGSDITAKDLFSKKGKTFDNAVHLLYEQALMLEGMKIDDTNAFVKRLNDVLSKSL